MEKRIVNATNEMEGTNFTSLDECFDIYTPDELIDFWLNYEGIQGYTNTIKEVFETFYIMIPKTI